MSQSQTQESTALFPIEDAAQPYQVLARKYRPTKLSELIGQELLATVLRKGIESGRLGHAFILTGIRGTGKTTTARIMARALNCTGPDGKSGPTPEPCGICPSCVAIATDRHMDVIEIDAASRTSVEDIREIIEAARYKAISARYKIYIIDEVHMLSKSAFNALLKTLEEPPSHVKFIFATTEIHKVPQTILSRCLRFDLRRIDIETLKTHFAAICQKEGIAFEEVALFLIARAAEGSARDGLSLLDQAITRATNGETQAYLKASDVQEMLGLMDFGPLYALFENLAQGEIQKAISQLREMIGQGADPVALLKDFMNIVHHLTLLKATPDLELLNVPFAEEKERLRGLSQNLAVPALTRLWQALLKGYQEILSSPHPIQALEMLLVRISYLSSLPPLESLIKNVGGLEPDGSKKKS
ncbi:DNA polymerase III subunit gamma/tau [Candidatus Bealeia paramacronuclearis]|uniref:DNA polymerase III subunit gamma/tau n=1 Tax=Candidatus Bealeia paramacronuclearis TaxID=1921001 RepID=A0ABZ2C1X9_9PROT|nr:DNA polymerase III subunit gamma/tau [Candidatus Bealeia paramacronuclearis]